MLSIHIIVVGRDKEKWISDQIDYYRKLISRYARLEFTALTGEKYGKGQDINRGQIRHEEGVDVDHDNAFAD